MKEYADLEEIWKSEKASQQGAADVRAEIEKVKLDMEQARRKGDLTSVARFQYEQIPALEKRLAQAQIAESAPASTEQRTRRAASMRSPPRASPTARPRYLLRCLV